MRGSLLLAAFVFVIQIEVIAQVPDSVILNPEYILTTKNYTPGVYRNFEEFKYNNPGTQEFTIREGRPYIKNGKTGALTKIRNREAWGYCDGSKIYVRRRKYNEMIGQGRYCYFTEKGWRVHFLISFSPPGFLPIPLPYSDVVIINFNNGKPYRLTKGLLKRILAIDDQQLLKQFKADTQKKKKLVGYVNLYNQRNAHRIKN